MNKPVHINKRLKDRVSNVSMYLKPIQPKFDNNGNISYSHKQRDNLIVFRIIFTIKDSVGQDLPIEKQTVHFEYEDFSHSISTKPIPVEQAKHIFGELSTELSKSFFMLRETKYAPDLILPVIRNVIFNLDYSVEDTAEFEKIVESNKIIFIENETKAKEAEKLLKIRQKERDAEFNHLSSQDKISQLKQELKALEEGEEKLLKDLDQKFEIDKLKASTENIENKRFSVITKIMSKSAKSAASKFLNINFSRIESLITGKDL